MNTNIRQSAFILFSLLASNCSVYTQDLPIAACTSSPASNPNFTKAATISHAMESLVSKGVPGCAMTVYSSEGWWSYATGYAKIENKTAMQTCHLQYLQSVAKTYMAVGILKLYEEGRIDLDAPMTQYLTSRFHRYIARGKEITVRMLLNHTSGVPEYNGEPAYVAYLLQHPNHYFTPEDYLRYIEGKDLTFEPGSKYSYRNTNYVLLALIADGITGDHAAYLDQVIINPLSLTNTFYRGAPNYLRYENLVNTYWDRHSNSILENASELQRNNVAALVGDDGIVATPEDAVRFLKALMEGQIISPATLEIMKTWALNAKGQPEYGLGLDYANFNGHIGYGHSGGGIGAGCQLYYFPEKNTYMFIGINLGTVTASPIHSAAEETLEAIHEALLK